MKEFNKIIEDNIIYDKLIQNTIKKIGMDRTLIKMKNMWKKESTSIIKDSYNIFRKDMRCYPFSGIKKDNIGIELIKAINSNKNNLPIFEIEEDDIEYDIDFPVIPYKKFYIASNSCEIINNEFYTFGGFFVLEYKTHLLVIFRWSRRINDGWAFSSFSLNKDKLYKSSTDISICFDKILDKQKDIKQKDIVSSAIKKFSKIMKKLIYKINRNEYSSYKIYSHGTYTDKKISRDVRGHIRHFWTDSGRFILPTLPKEELLKRGYKIAELAIRDGTLRKNVPFIIVSEFKICERLNKKNNRVYDLIEKRIWRCEEKIFIILKELFPNNIIRRHDRRTLRGLELDFNLPEFRLGIEYDGEQHFDRDICERVFKSDFDAQVSRDRKKDKLCNKKNIKLLRIKYNEPLTKTYIKKRLKEMGVINV